MGGVLQERTNVRKVARAVRRSWPPPVWPTMSFKCWGLKPSGPPAEPFGNDLMALIPPPQIQSWRAPLNPEETEGYWSVGASASELTMLLLFKIL